MPSDAVAPPPPHVRLKLILGLPLALLLLAVLGHFYARPLPANAQASVPLGTSPSLVPAVADAGPDGPVDVGDLADATSDAPAMEVLADGAVVVDLNHASEAELRRLPGIGPTRARAILALRVRLGRFRTVDDLARIQGFGRALLRKLRVFARTL